MRLLSRWRQDRRGAAAMLTALALFALMGSAALAVDVGQIFLGSRRLQGMADLAAMSAAQSLDGGAGSSSAAQTAATATVATNPWRGQVAVATVTGTYTPDPTLPAATRFQANATAPTAAKVTLTAPVDLVFGSLLLGRNTVTVSRSATAATAQLAAFSIGSGLAALNGGVANALLSALTGSQVQLSVMNYQALLGAHVDLLTYMSALATRLNVQGASYDSLLSGSVALPTALGALGDALALQGQGQAAAVVQQIANAGVSAGPVQLSTLFDLGPYGGQDHGASAGGASVSLGAGNLAYALLSAANGQRQLSLNLGANVPGLAGLSVWLAVGQRPSHSPWITVTDSQSVIVRTAQTRLYIQASLAPGLLGNAAGLVNVPIYVELASAQAKLSTLQCPADPTARSVTLSVSPSVGELALGQVSLATLNDFTTPEQVTPAVLLNAALIQATGTALITVGGGSAGWQPVSFTNADISGGVMKSVFTSDIAQATIASLLANTSLQVQAPLLGLSLGLGALNSSVLGVLQQAGAPLDGVLGEVSALSGVRLGEADVWVDGLRCHGAALVG